MVKLWGNKVFRMSLISCLLIITVLAGSLFNITSAPNQGVVTLGQKVITLGSVAEAAGSVDYTFDGVADDVQLQAALDALPATGGRLVIVSSVQINLTALTTVTRAINNVIIEGSGRGTYFVGDGATAIFTAGGNNWQFINFRTDTGGVSNGATTGWMWTGVTIDATYYAYRSPYGNSAFNDATVASLTDSGLTNGRVPIAGVGGLLGDSGNLTWDTNTLVTNTANVTALNAGSITDSGLTSGRILIAGASGLLGDDADLTWSGGDTLNTANISTGGLSATADLDIGNWGLRAQTLESDVATGTAPFTIASTTKVTNLNTDLVDGYQAGRGVTYIVAASNSPANIKAQADYIADNSTDNVEIQAALDALPANGGTVVLAPGDYAIAAQVNITKSVLLSGYGARLTGSGAISIIDTNWHWLQAAALTPWSPMTVEGLMLIGSPGDSTVGIHLQDTYGASFRDIMISGVDTGLTLENVANNSETNEFDNIWIDNPLTGIKFAGVGGFPSFSYNNFNHIRIRLTRDNAIGMDIQANSGLTGSKHDIQVWLSDQANATYSAFKIATNPDSSDILWSVDNFVVAVNQAGVYAIEVSGAVTFTGHITLKTFGQAFTTKISPTTAIVGLQSTVEVYKTANESTNNSAALQNDDTLLMSIGTNETWLITLFLRLADGTTGGGADFKYAITVPAGTDISYGGTYEISGAASATDQLALSSGDPLSVDLDNDERKILIVHVMAASGATAGTVQLQWAQNAAVAANTYVLGNSSLTAVQLK